MPETAYQFWPEGLTRANQFLFLKFFVEIFYLNSRP